MYLVYKATSPSGKLYIGMTSKSLEERKDSHIWAAKTNSKKRIFYCALQKYDYNFSWEIIENNLSKEAAEALEIKLIEEFKSTDRDFGYNAAKGGMAGNIRTPEMTDKWKKSMEKYYSDPAYNKKITKHLVEVKEQAFQDWLKTDSEEVKIWRKKCSENLTRINKSASSRLKRAKRLGGKPFMCNETGEVFELLQDAADKIGVDKRRIHSVLKYPHRYKSIMKKYTFKYIEKEL